MVKQINPEDQSMVDDIMKQMSERQETPSKDASIKIIKAAHEQLVALAADELSSQKAKDLLKQSEDRLQQTENASREDLQQMAQIAENAADGVANTERMRANKRENN